PPEPPRAPPRLPDPEPAGTSSSRRFRRGASSTAHPVCEGLSTIPAVNACDATTPASMGGRRHSNIPGSVLLSQGVYPQVPSARAGLTAVFGMGTGVSPPPWPPGNLVSRLVSEHSIASTNVCAHVVCAIKPSAD